MIIHLLIRISIAGKSVHLLHQVDQLVVDQLAAINHRTRHVAHTVVSIACRHLNVCVAYIYLFAGLFYSLLNLT